MGTDANHGGGESAEIMELNEKTGTYAFKQLPFGHANPINCKVCHFGRPIWDSDRIWPEAYGNFWLYDLKRQAQYKKFLETNGMNGIFQYIPRAEYGDLMIRNSEFTSLLHRVDSMRIANAIQRLKDEPRYRIALFAAFSDLPVEQIIQELPGRPPFDLSKKHQALIEDTKKEIILYHKSRLARAHALAAENRRNMENDLQENLKLAERIAKLRLVFGEMGAPEFMDNWAQILPPPEKTSILDYLKPRLPKRAFAFSSSYGTLLDEVFYSYATAFGYEMNDVQ